MNISLASGDSVVWKQETTAGWRWRSGRREGSCPSPVLREPVGGRPGRRLITWAEQEQTSEEEGFCRKLGSIEEEGETGRRTSDGLTHAGIFST